MTNLVPGSEVTAALSDTEKKFIEVLFENGGNVAEAKRESGYAAGTNPLTRKKIQDAIIEYGRFQLALHTPKAVAKMTGVLDTPTELGNDKLLEASKQILDRVGIVKKEQLEIDNISPNAILILPPKNKED